MRLRKTNQKNKNSNPRLISVQFQDETIVHPALKEYFGYCLFKVSAKFRALMQTALNEFELQTHHLGIMKVIEKSGPIRQIDLGEQLGIDKASIVKLVDELERKKYVVRKIHVTDRRVKEISMTSRGQEMLKSCLAVKQKTEREFFKDFSAEDEAKLRSYILTLLKNS